MRATVWDTGGPARYKRTLHVPKDAKTGTWLLFILCIVFFASGLALMHQ